MAKIGLNNFRYGLLTENPDGTASYGGAHKPAKAASCSVSITSNSATLYADDVLAESDTSFQSGTVTIGLDDSNSMARYTEALRQICKIRSIPFLDLYHWSKSGKENNHGRK